MQCYRDYIKGAKRSEHQADLSPAPETELKSEWSYTSIPLIRFRGLKDGHFKIFFNIVHKEIYAVVKKPTITDTVRLWLY
jgi:hypothetical protein